MTFVGDFSTSPTINPNMSSSTTLFTSSSSFGTDIDRLDKIESGSYSDCDFKGRKRSSSYFSSAIAALSLAGLRSRRSLHSICRIIMFVVGVLLGNLDELLSGRSIDI